MNFAQRIAALWDKIPVKGPMIAIVTVIGVILAFTGPSGKDCAQTPLRHVYHSSRLHVLATCQRISFQIVAWRLEHDGDYHVNGRVLDDSTWINQGNVDAQHGLTVIEFVPGDPRPPKFRSGMVLQLVVTKVRDWDHTGHWIEGHPVFSYVTLVQGSSMPDPQRLIPEEDRP